jgi:hypothetical protein
MSVDISHLLNFLSGSEWDGSNARLLAERGAATMAATIQHDAEAGEEWIRLLRDKKVLALVHVKRRLVIVAPRACFPVDEAEAVVVLSSSMSLKQFVANPDDVEAAFPCVGASQTSVLREAFSIDDLWWATV